MKFTKPLAVAAAFAAAGTIGLAIGSPMAAADPTTQNLGTQGKLVDAAGQVVQGWTVSGLKVSTDVIPHPVYGTLWEATATDEAIQGGVTPIISNLNARARNGQTYRVLFGAATPQGVNPATLAQGEKTTGKVYFDVTGEAPDSVVYNAGGVDLLVWVRAPEPQGNSLTPLAPRYTGGTGGSTTGATPTAPEGATPGEPAATESTEGQPPAANVPGETLPTGSQGTPLPPGSTGTPTGSEGTPTGSTGTPLPAGTAPASTAPAGTAPAGTAPAGAAPASAGTGTAGTAPSAGTPAVVVPPPAG